MSKKLRFDIHIKWVKQLGYWTIIIIIIDCIITIDYKQKMNYKEYKKYSALIIYKISLNILWKQTNG
jgi:predicted small integral membrane protein